jgi:DNA polymerase-4
MWGVGPATQARLAGVGVTTIGQLAAHAPRSVERLLGGAVGRKLTALAWNRDPRAVQTHRRAHSAGAQSALGRRPAAEHVYRPVLLHLAERVASRLRAKARSGRTVSVRVRFADLRSVSRALTLPSPISATMALADIATDLVRSILRDYPHEQTISLVAVSVSHLEEEAHLQLELPFDLPGDGRRPGARKGMARLRADRALDTIRRRFGPDAVGYASSAAGLARSVPDAFRSLAEKDL